MLRPLLAPDARVALVAPSGPLAGEHELERASENVRSFGWEPVVFPHALSRDGYFAGADADRLADLNAAFADPAIDGVWCVRGGYGAMRLLEGLDLDAARSRPRALLGYSDITALHAALGARCGVVTYHAPTARAVITPFARASLERAVVQGSDSCGIAPEALTLRAGRARGRLVGGNLALLAALAGTPWAPSYDGAILVIEDVNEAVYRIDRMLMTLRLGGSLSRLAGLVFGQFTNAPEESDDGSRRLLDVLAETAAAAGVPCLAGVPVGHIGDQWTLPLGAEAELDADRCALTIASVP
ncbi:MAG: hypothetical protein JWO05_2630 [Gemmatimonadetes bacterium]|nr:hypothetical protein [Gemmatimonadota bacterium]